MTTTLRFRVPDHLVAEDPVEASGRPRSDVRLLVSRGTAVRHHRFEDLERILEPGDLLVANTSATLPAAVDLGGGQLLHLSGRQPGGGWLVEPRRRCKAGSRPDERDMTGTTVRVGAARVTIRRRVVMQHRPSRLWTADVAVPGGDVAQWLAEHGRPIRYGCPERAWPLRAYQTVFARDPGSAEMPSAARPFTRRLLRRLARRGVALATVTLHTGVSSLEAGEPPYPEWYRVPHGTVTQVARARARGRSVIAVGTTVVRALESAAERAGEGTDLAPAEGWTDLVVTPQRGVRVIDGLLTGWHEPEATHLWMLEAVAGRPALDAAYAAALAGSYRWHEFGDSHLLLPGHVEA